MQPARRNLDDDMWSKYLIHADEDRLLNALFAILIQPLLIEAELTSGQLVLPFPRPVDTGRGYYMCSRAALAQNDAMESFTRWLADEANASAKRFGMPAARRRA